MAQITINASYICCIDLNATDSTYSRSTTDLRVGFYNDPIAKKDHKCRVAIKFSLADLPSGSDVTAATLQVNVTVAGGASHLTDIRPYTNPGQQDNDGQSNPETDGNQTCYDSCNNIFAACYIFQSTALRTTGVKNFDLPSGALTDIENAKSAVNRFSLGLFEDIDNDPYAALSATLSDSKLTITYTPPAPPVAFPGGGLNLKMAKAILGVGGWVEWLSITDLITLKRC